MVTAPTELNLCCVPSLSLLSCQHVMDGWDSFFLTKQTYFSSFNIRIGWRISYFVINTSCGAKCFAKVSGFIAFCCCGSKLVRQFGVSFLCLHRNHEGHFLSCLVWLQLIFCWLSESFVNMRMAASWQTQLGLRLRHCCETREWQRWWVSLSWRPISSDFHANHSPDKKSAFLHCFSLHDRLL